MIIQDIEAPEWDFKPDRTMTSSVDRFAALIEILLVIGASFALALIVQRLVSSGLAQTLGLTDGRAPNFLAASLVLIKQLGLQYGGLALIVLFLAALRRRRSRQSYALTRGSRSIRQLLLIGLVGGAFAAIPSQVIFLAKEIFPLGTDTPIWTIVEQAVWDWRFWTFMAVGSFVFVPILEELTWRSYALGRLVENFGPGAALITTAVIFGLMHTQYLANGDALGYLTLASVIFSALVFGVLTLWTGSVLPAIIAHVMINIPKTFEVGIVVLVIYIGLSLLAIRPIATMTTFSLKSAFSKDTAIAFALIVIVSGLAIIAVASGTIGLIIFALLSLTIALSSALIRKSVWAAATSESVTAN